MSKINRALWVVIVAAAAGMLIGGASGAANPIGAGAGLGIGLGVVALILFYWLPALIAYGRHLNNVSQIVLVNLLAGWTFVGWLVALVWAAKPAVRQAA